jgi:hypothetical protein
MFRGGGGGGGSIPMEYVDRVLDVGGSPQIDVNLYSH